MLTGLGLVLDVKASSSVHLLANSMFRTPQFLKGPQALAFGLCGLAAMAIAGPQQAQAVTVSFTSAQLPQLCGSGTCHFDVLPTNPINYTQLDTAYPPSYSGYNYNFSSSTVAIAFANAYQALVPWATTPANNGNPGFGEIPSSPGGNNPGGPLFFTGVNTSVILPGPVPPLSTLTQVSGQYYTTTSTNFTASEGGTGVLETAAKQKQVWAVFKCTSGVCVPTPGPLPILGASAAFGYSRRLRNRVQGSKA